MGFCAILTLALFLYWLPVLVDLLTYLVVALCDGEEVRGE